VVYLGLAKFRGPDGRPGELLPENNATDRPCHVGGLSEASQRWQWPDLRHRAEGLAAGRPEPAPGGRETGEAAELRAEPADEPGRDISTMP
jgi:hypothetical protein